MMPRHAANAPRAPIQAGCDPHSSTGNMEACLEKLSIDHNSAFAQSNLLLASGMQMLDSSSSSVLPNKSIVELLAGESTTASSSCSETRGGVTPAELIEWNMNEESTRDLAAALSSTSNLMPDTL